MKRLFVALTLLLMSFLAALDNLEGLHALPSRIGIQRWMTELVLASLAVGLFVRASQLHRRLLFPRRGLRLLAAGIAVYAVAVAAASGIVARGIALLAMEQGGWPAFTELVAGLETRPVFLAAQLLLVVGAFRALANLVPPAEFEADY
jgi:hypothetical protein